MDGILYDRGAYGQDLDVPAGDVDLRTTFGRVGSRAASHDLREGEATYLEPGTRLHAVEGYDPSFRLAARRDGGWALYEVAHNPGAKKPSELLDVGGKVESVGVEDTFEGTAGGAREEAAALLGPEETRTVVGAALDSPLVKVSPGPFRYLVVFHLEDGTRSLRWYEPGSGELYLSEDPGERDPYAGVVLPEAPREAILRALPG